ncbi:ketopantoate reductase family protein [Euzebya sp.]|uniref:ketopantoate reductase family protein n=1 Tax=Euzebya sp. TaxID=1971409 RepID=UPI003513B6C0
MRVLIAGAGSLGTVYGGFLARAGHDVQLLCRPAHAAAVTGRGGVEVRSIDETFVAPLRATADPTALDAVDVVVLACKAPDTSDLLGGIAHLAGSVSTAVSIQNGVTGGAALAGWCDPSAVVGGVSMVGGTLVEPGVVAHTLAGPTFVGPLGGTRAGAAAQLADELGAAGLEAVLTDRITSVEWSKLVHASPSMALTALTRLDFHHVFVQPNLAEAFLDLVVEGVAIADAAGVAVDDWPHLLPVRTLARLPRAEGLAAVAAHGRRLVDAGMTSIRISMLQSIERGRRTEVDAIHGQLAREAARLGVAAPATRFAHQVLSGLDRVLVHQGGEEEAPCSS